MRETANIDSSIGGRNAADFTSSVQTETTNAVNSGLVKDAADNALQATEASHYAQTARAAATAKTQALAGRIGNGGAAGLKRGQEASVETGDGTEDATQGATDVASDTGDYVMQIARSRRNAAMRAEAANAAEETGYGAEVVGGLEEGVEARTGAEAAQAMAGTSARNSLLNSMSASKQATAKEGKTTSASANETSKPVKALGETEAKAPSTASAGAGEAGKAVGDTAASTIKSPLKTGTGASKLSAAALAKTKSALLEGKGGKNATGATSAPRQAGQAGQAGASTEDAVVAATGVASSVVGAVTAVAAAAAPIIGVIIVAGIAISIVTSLITSIFSVFVAAMEEERSGGKAFAEFVLNEAQTGDASGWKYQKYSGLGSDAAWCSAFIWYCWDKSGMTEVLGSPQDAGFYAPRANCWIRWANADPSKGTIIRYNSSYTPLPGDILVYGEYEVDISEHVGAVGAVYEDGSYMRCEGNNLNCQREVPGQGEWTWVFRANFPSTGGAKAIAGESGWMTIDEFMMIGVSDRYGWHYTYYSETVLPGGGLDIPGRHLEGVCVCDAEGYVVVACDTLPRGSIVPTPLRDGKVYDCGVNNPNGIDVYVHYP